MRPITQFDPTVAVEGTIDTNGINANEQLMLYNDSIIGMMLEFADGSKDLLPALWNKDFIISNVPMGVVKWSFYNTLNLSNNPLTSCYGTLYEPGEHVASVNASMQRNVVSSIPGGVNANLSNLQNTGNNPGTNVITIQPNDAISAVILIDNSGNVTIKGDNAGVLTLLLQLIAGASPAVNIMDTNYTSGGNFNLPTNAGIFTFSGGSSAGLTIGTGSSNAPSTHSDGVAMAKLYLTSGRLTRIQGGTIACGSGTSISHGLGVTPASVFITPDIAQPGSGTVGAGSYGSSTFTATIGAGSTANWEAKTYV